MKTLQNLNAKPEPIATADQAAQPAGLPAEINAAKAAAILGVGRGIVYRLYHAHFIKGRMPGPRCLFLDSASVLAHLKATKDPEFWERNQLPW